MVLVEPYASPATIARRARAAITTADRSAGLDAPQLALYIRRRLGLAVMRSADLDHRQ